MKKLYILFLSVALISSVQAQLAIDQPWGYNPTGDFFPYLGKNVGHYSLGWYATPGSAEARLSGYGGVSLFTHAQPRLHVAQDGDVGIGTTIPQTNLHVSSSGGGFPASEVVPSNGILVGGEQTTGVLNLGIDATASVAPEFYSWIQSRNRTTNDFYNLSLNPEGGNVGIGTNAPDQALVVNGNVSFLYPDGNSYNGLKRNGVATEYYNGITGTPTNVIHQFTGSNNTIMSLTQGGNVGIGTTDPSSKLHLVSGNQTIKFLTGTISSGYTLNVGVNDDGVNFSNNSLIRGFNFSNATGTLLRIKSNGNVGIGAEEPDADLHIKNDGTSTGTSLLIENTAWNNPDIKFKGVTDQADLQYFDQNNNLYSVFRIGKNTNGAYLSFQDRTSGTAQEVFKVTNGITYAKEVIVTADAFPDYVFRDGYELKSLDEVEACIQREGHLPNMPSEQEVVENGMNLNEITILQQEKIEELTLYLIALQKEVNALKASSIK